MGSPIIFETEFYRVHHETSFFIPGYLIIFPKERTTNWADFTNEALMSLGPLIALSHTCVDSVIKPERIYTAQYGEIERNIHIHIFPRSEDTTAKYLSSEGLEPKSKIAGPALMDWVFNNKHLFTAPQKEIDEMVNKISCKYQQLIQKSEIPILDN